MLERLVYDSMGGLKMSEDERVTEGEMVAAPQWLNGQASGPSTAEAVPDLKLPKARKPRRTKAQMAESNTEDAKISYLPSKHPLDVSEDVAIALAPVAGLFTIRAFFNWHDAWVGVYLDTKKRIIYVCPLPMFGIKITY